MGGITSQASGGDFNHGAMSALMVHLFNDTLRRLNDRRVINKTKSFSSSWKYRKLVGTSDIPNYGKLKKVIGNYIEVIKEIDLQIQEGSRVTQEHLLFQEYSYDVYVDDITFKPTTERFNFQDTKQTWEALGQPMIEKNYRFCMKDGAGC